MDEGALQALLDENAIRAAMARYARGVDRGDEELIRSVYHEDSRDERGWFNGSGWEFARVIAEELRERDRNAIHLITNIQVELEGATAKVESYTLALSSARDETGPVQTFAGRYLDRFDLKDGEWRISRRVVVREFTAALERQAVTGYFRDMGEQNRGAFAPDDVSYDFEGGFGGTSQ